jgi:hypothetical protein
MVLISAGDMSSDAVTIKTGVSRESRQDFYCIADLSGSANEI